MISFGNVSRAGDQRSDIPSGLRYAGVLRSGQVCGQREIAPVHRKDREVFCSIPAFEEWVQAMRDAMLFFRKNRKRIMDNIAAIRPTGPSPPKPVSLDLVIQICGLHMPHLDMKGPVQVCLILPFLLILLWLLSST